MINYLGENKLLGTSNLPKMLNCLCHNGRYVYPCGEGVRYHMK